MAKNHIAQLGRITVISAGVSSPPVPPGEAECGLEEAAGEPCRGGPRERVEEREDDRRLEQEPGQCRDDRIVGERAAASAPRRPEPPNTTRTEINART